MVQRNNNNNNNNKSRSFFLWCGSKCFHKSEEDQMKAEANGNMLAESKRTEKKPGGWKAMPFILGFAPLFGAYISDARVGRFPTIAVASFASLLGMVTITLMAWLPQLHPPTCDNIIKSSSSHCLGPNKSQLGVLLAGLSLLSIGAGGIRPCSIPFAIDQFDPTTEEGKKGINSFYNWYYTSFTIVLLISQTVVVYIQDSVSWVIGFGLPTILMACAILMFFVGTKIYVNAEPEGSIYSSIFKVFVAAFRKRHLKLPDEGDQEKYGVYYDPPMKENTVSKMPLTSKYRFLNKAALITENDLKQDGTPADNWNICSIQQEEEVKCLIQVIPIWVSGIISLTAIGQQSTFTISQSLIMDKHLGPNFQIPAASITVISLITIGIWLPFYDRIFVPSLRKITRVEGGVTNLQRMGIGIVFSFLSMVVAGLVERDRRASAISNPNGPPMSVFWLAPQLIVMGLCEAFNIIGLLEFFNREFPEKMRGFGNSLFVCSFAGSSYVSSAIITIVHKVTGTKHHPNWLANDLNKGKLDYFYFLIAGLGVLNFFFFLYVAQRYHYKPTVSVTASDDVELSSEKP
ncbi:hypothetical protein ACFE04_023058 [Oxalis oulophora]